MQVLKFGGTSVANADNILKVIDIIRLAAEKDQTIVVVSALGGTTNLLIEAGRLAAVHDVLYKEKLQEFGDRHQLVVLKLIPIDQQIGMLKRVKEKCSELESICEAVFLLR